MPTIYGDEVGQFQRDTIVALSSAPGKSAIAVVRMSGARVVEIAEKIFHPKNASVLPGDRKLRVGKFAGPDGCAFDEGMAVLMAGPRSFTGEDMAEFYCHGGSAVVRALLTAACDAGARPAEPGEFTRRAYLEGKIDLVQCESVADLISAETASAARAALNHLEGGLSKALRAIWEKIIEVGALLEAAIDFPDEFGPVAGPFPGEPIGRSDLDGLFSKIVDDLADLESTYQSGRVLREGARVVILGRPNAGKSTLLNRFLGVERAIMSPIPGTTRDTVEEVCEMGGIPVRLIDTAGLRDTGDPVELEGTDRARRSANAADLCLVVVDATLGSEEVDWAKNEIDGLDSPVILAVNKVDLPQASLPEKNEFFSRTCAISALTGEGLDQLRDIIATSLLREDRGTADDTQGLLTRERHRDLVMKCRKAIESGRNALEHGLSPELVAVDLNEGQRAFSELLGCDYAQDLLDKLFSTFCIGK